MIEVSKRLHGMVARAASRLRRARGIALEARSDGVGRALARIGRAIRRPRPLTYAQWIARYDQLDAPATAAVRRMGVSLSQPALLSVIVDAGGGDETALLATVGSVRGQLYDMWEMRLADASVRSQETRDKLELAVGAERRIIRVADLGSAIEGARGSHVVFVRAGDVLPPHALAVVAEAVERMPDAALLYSDEDRLDGDGNRSAPFFKPDWSPELALHLDYVSRLGVMRAPLARLAGTPRLHAAPGGLDAALHGLILRATAISRAPVVHIPHVLYHRCDALAACDTGSDGSPGPTPEMARPRIGSPFRSASWPRVAVIVPTRDHADVLDDCMTGLLDGTDYPALEIIIADNGSIEPATAGLFEQLKGRGVSIVDTSGPFNFSRINNQAAATTDAELLLFLNNDISMIEPDWLKQMVRHMAEPDVGAVGAKLLYPDGTLQHGGVVLGMLGVAGHLQVGAPGFSGGYGDLLRHPRDVSCVTAACMLMRRRLFEQIGGFDEVDLAVAFNDVDLCVRMRQAGHRIIWTPRATLIHHESKSRGDDTSGAKLRRFQDEAHVMRTRWGPVLDRDPFWNPNLSLGATEPQWAVPPRVQPPWRP